MLEHGQAAFAKTLLHGPDHLPAGLFAGSDAAVLRALRAHANTVSHARLIALEETFPRVRDYLGEGEFHRLSRAFIDSGGSEGQSLSNIGAGFAEGLTDPIAIDLACLEWAWLESYHAADAPAFALGDLAGHDEAALLGWPVRLHPAARLVLLASGAAPLVDPIFDIGTKALLVVRPDADVQLLPIHAADAAALCLAKEISPLGNLLAHLAEHHPDGGAAIARLIDAGAFERL